MGANHAVSASSIDAFQAGHLDFVLEGEKLKGKFSLVRMHLKNLNSKKHWILMKRNDEYALHDRPEKPTTQHKQSKLPLSVDDLPLLIPRQKSKMSDLREVSYSNETPQMMKFTNLDKIMFPEIDATKGDLIEYYKSVSPELLNLLKDRPVTLERWPDGVTGSEAPHLFYLI